MHRDTAKKLRTFSGGKRIDQRYHGREYPVRGGPRVVAGTHQKSQTHCQKRILSWLGTTLNRLLHDSSRQWSVFEPSALTLLVSAVSMGREMFQHWWLRGRCGRTKSFLRWFRGSFQAVLGDPPETLGSNMNLCTTLSLAKRPSPYQRLECPCRYAR